MISPSSLRLGFRQHCYSGRTYCAFVVTLWVCLSVSAPACALPPGRAWAPVQQLVVPNYNYLPSPRLETDSSGLPRMFVSAWNGNIVDGVGVCWVDSTWQVCAQTDIAMGTLQPVSSPQGTFYLVWGGGDASNSELLEMGEFKGSGLASIDTAAHVLEYTSLYSAAVAPGGRRWIAVNDNFVPRLLYSDTLRIWNETPLPFPDAACLAVATLTDTTALLVVQVGGFMRWGIANGRIWQDLGQLTQFGNDMVTFRVRPRLPDSQLLVWDSNSPTVSIASYQNGTWGTPQTLTCAYQDPRVDYTFWPNMSHDAGKYPVVTWQAYNGHVGGDLICACVPTDSGFTTADQIWSATYAIHPVAARDQNGDAWIAWWSFDGGTFWTHTYTRATTSPPSVLLSGTTASLTWQLSEPAPETWWGILRATDAGAYALIRRVRAGTKLTMAWGDTAPPPGVNHYRLRRETVDARYQWQSGEATVVVGVPSLDSTGRLRLLRASSNPAGATSTFEILNAAAGRLDVQVFDLHGRLLLRIHPIASGTGRDTIQLDLSLAAVGPGSGLYFVRAVDAAGSVSSCVKVALLR